MAVDLIERLVVQEFLRCWRTNFKKGMPCFFVYVRCSNEFIVRSELKILQEFIQEKLNVIRDEDVELFLGLLKEFLEVSYK